jgi:hypothetical protein
VVRWARGYGSVRTSARIPTRPDGPHLIPVWVSLRQAVTSPATIAWLRAPGDRGDVDQVPATIAQLVEERLGGGDCAEQIDLDHLAQLGALIGGERCQQA